MYYPYLRGRQFELIALRELAGEQATQGFVIPILEPVRDDHKGYELAYNILQSTKQQAFMIVNPTVGAALGDTHLHLDYLEQLNSHDVYLPAFHYASNAKYIKQAITQYSLTKGMLICKNEVVPDRNFASVAELPEISAIVVEDPGRNRELNRYIKKLGKTYIRLDDLFEKEARNQNYLPVKERRFSEEHKYFEEEGFQGFSDYTVLSSEYTDSGSTPRAVVIHLTYMNEDKEIWLRSFTSVTNDSIANIQGKFGEAVTKAAAFCEATNLSNSATAELLRYFHEKHYPGLGMIKKISIKNHLLVVTEFLKQAKEAHAD